ncbi:uncharacterized protein UHOD_00607 [Ustilago sp. UG-2017b]|nr:uncharacterized protein UHOD_00607 [Ustilago sp. UG-2017b]
MPSFSANRQSRPRPSNISFGRRRSDEKSMSSPSFNSSMSLGHVEDVFCDSLRSVDRLRHHYLAMPATPSSLSAGSAPGARMERLPSLTDLFHRDILSPQSSGLLPLSSLRSEQGVELMNRSGSRSSTPSGRGWQWNTSFSQDAPAGSIGPLATPLSPYFFDVSARAQSVSPRTTSSGATSSTILTTSDGERTPRAASRASFYFVAQPADSGRTSPRCPGAPLIGANNRGHFDTQSWQQHQGNSSLGPFLGLQRRTSYGIARHERYTAEAWAKKRAAMSRLEASLPKVPGLNGLGIYMDAENAQSPFRKAAQAAAGQVQLSEISPKGRHYTASGHTGLTPMVKASKVCDVSSTPTRPKTKKSPSSLKMLSPDNATSTSTKTSPSATAAKRRVEPSKTPLNRSRPMFRLDTGSGKKSFKPKGHKMSPDASPWGVFGGKGGWKPLAPSNVSRAIAEANRLVAETAAVANATSSPSGKREANSTLKTVSPSKRPRATENSSPYKENMAPSLRNLSPSKRAHLLSPTYRDSPTALPLSTIR